MRLLSKTEINITIAVAIVLIIISLTEIMSSQEPKDYSLSISIIAELGCSVIATIIVLYFQRLHESRVLHNRYESYIGTYQRIDIGRDNAAEDEINFMKSKNVNLKIKMTYKGGHEFDIEADYWENENAKVIGLVEFNPKDKQAAKGMYRYTQGVSYVGEYNHFGEYSLNWDDNQKAMIVFFQHKYPRKKSFNPDENKGWEVWKKV